jgi:phage major head subunit gpT-like protein
MPNLLVVGPSLEATAFSILKDRLKVSGVSQKAAATDNPWVGSGDYIVLPELQGSYAAAWFLCDVRNVYKPVLVQKRQEPEVIRRDLPTDDNMFYSQSIEYGVEAAGAATLTMPHLIYRGGIS